MKICIVLFCALWCVGATRVPFLWWEVKPYVYLENGIEKGILVDLMRKYNYYCTHNEFSYDFGIKENNFTSNYSGLLKLAMLNFSQLHPPLRNLSLTMKLQVTIFPILARHVNVTERGFVTKAWIHSPGASVIVRRGMISLYRKTYLGVEKSLPLLVQCGLIVFILGIIMWFWEKHFNPSFARSFPIGMSDGIWWAIITLSTVGYGDLVPMTTLARLCTFFWIFFGLSISAIITATVTDTLTSAEFSNINGRMVAVLAHSSEESIALQYNAKPKSYNTYADVLSAVRREDVDAALINSDIVSWMQDEIRFGVSGKEKPLHVVYQIKQEIPIWAIQLNPSLSSNHQQGKICYNNHSKEILDDTLKSYYKHTKVDTMHSPLLGEIFTFDSFGLYLVLFTITLIGVAALDDLICFTCRQCHRLKTQIKQPPNEEETERFKLHINSELVRLNENFEELKLFAEGLCKYMDKHEKKNSVQVLPR